MVTGGSGGIGRAIAERLAREGARLVLGFCRDAEAAAGVVESCHGLGAEAVSLQGDLGDPAAAAALCNLAERRYGRLDILVNNAGVAVEGPLALLDETQAQQMIATNVLGVVWTTRAAVRPMLRQHAGALVNISSSLAERPGRGNAVYAGTKGFVESFTKAMAVELGRKGIRVNAVRPGAIDTRMLKGVRGRAEETLLARVGLRRLGTPAEVAAAVAFLASDEAAYINGAVLAVDGAFLGGI